jgi:hypothetical protein
MAITGGRSKGRLGGGGGKGRGRCAMVQGRKGDEGRQVGGWGGWRQGGENKKTDMWVLLLVVGIE